VCFPLNISMVHSSILVITTDSKHLTYGVFSLGETVHFESLEFIADCFDNMSLSTKGSESSAVFIGTTSSGSPPLCTILKGSTNEFYTASSGEGSSGLPISRRRSMGTPPAPIATAPWSKDAPTPQTMMTVLHGPYYHNQTPGSLLSGGTPFGGGGNEHELMLSKLTLSARQHSSEASSPASKRSLWLIRMSHPDTSPSSKWRGS
jgi:hypothetical protein